MEKQKSMFNQNKEVLIECIDNYTEFAEKSRFHAAECKIINNFLCELPEGSHQILEIGDLKRLSDGEINKFDVKYKMLNDFVAAVKQECVVDRNYFIFFDIPELIVKKKYNRKDYDEILKVVKKVKMRYLAEKKKQFPDKPDNVVTAITDDDLVPLEMFDEILREIEHK
jgi:hypothetical protein